MTTNQKLIATSAFTILALAPIMALANVTGADPGLTGAPGESTCTECHSGTRINGGGGSIAINLPGGATYTPGVKQHIRVKVSDPSQRRWGFELTARANRSQAGDITSTDANTQVECANGRLAPCSSPSAVQFITHTLAGTRLGTTSSATFEFDWTPPSADVGTITLYAAGNAANGNNQDTGDHIYTTSVNLAVAAVSATPSITSVVNAANPLAGVTQGAWIAISGTNLSSTTRTWTLDELAAGPPLSLDNVSVAINGKAAFVEYVSPTLINALAPADDALGPVEVRVTSNGQTSDAAVVNIQPFAPALFTFDGKYVATTPGSNSLLDQAGTFFAAQLPLPVKPGDNIVLYGTGFGAVDASTLAITIGGAPAMVSSAGPADSMPQIYQLNVQVPAGLADGDQVLVVQSGGAASPGVYLAIQN